MDDSVQIAKGVAAAQPTLIPQDPFVFTDKMVNLIDLEDYSFPVVPASFQKSVDEYGVMEPIIVYESGRGDGAYKIADGRRRALAAFRAGLTKIPAMVVSGGDNAAQDFHKITLIANAQRGANQFSEYEAIMALVKFGKSEKEIAAETGMSLGTIKKRLKLNALPAVVREKIKEGVISAGAAEEAVKLSPDQMHELRVKLEDPTTTRVTHVEVQGLRDVDRTLAEEMLPDQLFMDEVKLTVEELFEDEVRSLTNRYTMVPPSEMVRVLQKVIALIEAGD